MMHLKKKDFYSLGVFALFILPAFGAILLSVEIPFIMSVIYSFTKWNGIDRVPVFIGLENYFELLTEDPNMMYAMVFTLEQTVLRVILTNVIALLLAVFLDGEIRGKNALRAAFYIPNIISLIVIGYIWFFIFSRGFTSFYQYIKFPPFMLSWLGDAKMAFISVLIVSIWQSIGFYMVIYIAGLQVVPRDMIEAAMIDGAGGIARFFRITIPLIMPSITVAVFHSVSNSLKSFDVIFSLTNGGPGHSTTSIALDIYKTAFVTSRFGYGTAKSVILFLLILVFTFFQVKFFKAREIEA
ncbi:MAG: sugar ABC transporter permease [Treponema sp.]|jgi:raffinose/stachyose/melibiose transport system permease protein|nr:sugar ABC transporter permease [Treponema sp.]